MEVSPSIEMRLNDFSAKSNARPFIRLGSMRASVAKKPNIVAILGLIMPAPLLIPVMVIS